MPSLPCLFIGFVFIKTLPGLFLPVLRQKKKPAWKILVCSFFLCAHVDLVAEVTALELAEQRAW